MTTITNILSTIRAILSRLILSISRHPISRWHRLRTKILQLLLTLRSQVKQQMPNKCLESHQTNSSNIKITTTMIILNTTRIKRLTISSTTEDKLLCKVVKFLWILLTINSIMLLSNSRQLRVEVVNPML
jgi:hypothetical protein